VPRTLDTQIHHGTPEFRRTTLALSSAGFATFALLYCIQPLMPLFARDFHVSAAESSLSLSLTTGLLAPAMIVAGVLSEARGRKTMMAGSLLASSAMMIVSAFITQWKIFLVVRALAGLAFAGLPAISMAYLGEEVHPTSIGLGMGLAIGANGLGGMVGRLLAAVITNFSSWRWAIGAVGSLGLVATVIFWRSLPPSRHFSPRPIAVRALLRTFRAQFGDRRLVALFAMGFILMGAFVTTYNYATYHLLEAPYSLSQAAVGFIFVVYLVGIFASAWIGSLADRAGRGRMLSLMAVLMLAGVALTLSRALALVVIGIATVTFGFFGGHSVASSWVGLHAHEAKAQAAALYLFFYYMGSSIAGSVGGLFWDRAHWPGVSAFVAALLVAGMLISRVAAKPRPVDPRIAPHITP
jgi:YNFM family putative membrane transporter